MPVLKKVPVFWASVLTPNTQFEPSWEIQVELTNEQAATIQAEAKAINKKGVKISEEDGKKFIRFRRKVARADGKGNNPAPIVLGPDGEPFERLIGNGSICNVQYALSGYDNKFGKGVTTDLKGVRVLVHVPYGEQDGDGLLDDDEDPVSKPSARSGNEYDDDDDL